MPVTRGTPARMPNTPEPEQDEEEVVEEEQEPEQEQEEEPADDDDEEVDGDESDVEEEQEESTGEETESEETPSQPARRVGRPRNPDSPPPRPTLSKTEKAALFQAWEERRSIVAELREHLDTSKKEIAAAAFEIYEKLGGGPFRWKGKVIKVLKSKKFPNTASIRIVSDEAQDIG